MRDQIKLLIVAGELAEALGLYIKLGMEHEGLLLLGRLNFAQRAYQTSFISFKKYERIRLEIANAILSSFSDTQ